MTATAQKTTSDFPNLTDPRTFVEDVPYEAFARMRGLPGLHWQPTTIATANGGFWAVTRFADIVAVEKDPATFTSTKGAAYPGTNQQESVLMSDLLMMTDPPRHSHLRRAAAKGFGPRVVANFEPWVREIVCEVVDRIQSLDTFDWINEVARTIPARVVARVVGVPREDEPLIVQWTLAVFAAAQQTEDLEEGANNQQAVIKVMLEMAPYIEKLQILKREQPADDMFTELSRCVDKGELTQNEFLNWMFLMMTAGFETTHTAIGHSMRLYLTDQVVADRTDRAIGEGRTNRAMDEFLRLISPPMQMARTATRDLEFAGEQVRKDDVMVLYYAAANRDERVFANPDEFDPWRSETDSLAFGSGVHRCIGAYLAHLELKVLWEELHRRGLKLRLNGEPKRGWSVFINQLTSLPVRKA
ncbi:cytochrome P450 [Bradyrhizobium cenepequi]